MKRASVAFLALLHSGSALACPELPQAPSLDVKVALTDNGERVVCIDLAEGQRLGRVKVFLDEGLVRHFPRHLVAEVASTAENSWCGNTRKSWPWIKRWMHLDLRFYEQWFVPGVITPGNSYTIGFQAHGLDPKSATPVCLARFGYSEPFHIADGAKRRPLLGRPEKVRLADDIPLETWRVVHRKGESFFYFERGREVEMVSMEDQTNLVVISLADGRQLLLEKLRHRPAALGDPSFVEWVLLWVAAVMAVSLLFLLYLFHLSFGYLNHLAEPANDPRAIVRTILCQRFGVLIIFVLVTALDSDWPAKIVNVLLADLKDKSPRLLPLLKRLRVVFEASHVSEWRGVRQALARAIDQSPEEI